MINNRHRMTFSINVEMPQGVTTGEMAKLIEDMTMQMGVAISKNLSPKVKLLLVGPKGSLARIRSKEMAD